MKNTIIAVLVVVLILAGLFIFMGKQSGSPATNESDNASAGAEEQAAAESAATNDRGVRSLLELVGMGGEMTCTYSTDGLDHTYPTNGTMYMKAGKIRVDSVSIVDNKESRFSMIDDGTTTYTWGSSLDGEFAMKMPRQDVTEMASDPNAPETAFKYSEQVEYDCSAGGVNEGQFVPPTNVEFMDMEAMISGTMDAATMERMMQQYGGQ